mmetsp:Transcript_55904/g.133459  ORF Transcript_55904/g.133459 Transcript_55904/m.133459 type:complete len:286 (-) Transcript_55904:112-969(-)
MRRSYSALTRPPASSSAGASARTWKRFEAKNATERSAAESIIRRSTCRSGNRSGGGMKASATWRNAGARTENAIAPFHLKSIATGVTRAKKGRIDHQKTPSERKGSTSPSRRRRGNIDDSAICGMMCARAAASGDVGARSAAGRSANRIDFSCTWYEKRKKAREELRSAQSSARGVGFRSTEAPDGSSAITVVARASARSCGGLAQDRRRSRGAAAHQTLATLSSKSPRPIGKTRRNTCKAPSRPNASSQGERSTVKVVSTTTPREVTSRTVPPTKPARRQRPRR